MPFQDSEGTWWSDDGRHYRQGDQWYLYQKPDITDASVEQPQPSSPEASDQTGTSHQGSVPGNASASTVAAAFSRWQPPSPQPYQQPQQQVYGKSPQTPNTTCVPMIELDAEFKAGAQRSDMIKAFVEARAKMQNGFV